MKYFLVKCKFGHVGRNKYLPLVIATVAESAKKASENAKKVGGVKRDHKDWCLEEPVEVDYNVFFKARNEFENDVYFEKRSRSRLYLFKDRLIDEPNYSNVNGLKTNRKIYSKKRDKTLLKFKCKKEKVKIKSIKKEQLGDLINSLINSKTCERF